MGRVILFFFKECDIFMYFLNNLIDPFLTLESFIFNSSVKDMQPYNVYKKNKDYVIEVKTLGINPEDINVKLIDNTLEINGETQNPYGNKPFNTKISLSIDTGILSKLKKIVYKSKNGLTYITLITNEKESDIRIEKE